MENSRIVLCKSCGSYVSDVINIPHSPAPHLHRTLQVPDVSESTLISDSLSHARTSISELDAEIEKMSVVLKDLRNKRDGLHQFVIEHESLFAPIRRLPAEILNHIFFLCIPIPPPYVSSFNIQMAPLLLTRVCIGWRDSAWSSQRLWASFTIFSTAPFRDLLAESWLSHTRSSPLSVRLNLDSERRRQVRHMWSVVARMIQYCDRWKELTMDTSAYTLSRFGSIQHRLPWLESLSIDLHVGGHVDPIHVLEFAPRLRRVELKSIIRPSLLKLPWYQLTDLEARPDSMSSLLAILHLSSNLINLKLYSPTTHIETSLQSTAILPTLISLNVSLMCDTAPFVDKIRCPALRTLDMMTTSASWASDEFIIFLSSCKSLEYFLIEYTKRRGPTLDLVPCLQAVPWLTALCLCIDKKANWLMEDTLTRLTYTESAPLCLLPALEQFYAVETTLDGRLLAKMVQSRMASSMPDIAQLQVLRLDVDLDLFHFDQESMEVIAGAITSGLHIAIPDHHLFDPGVAKIGHW